MTDKTGPLYGNAEGYDAYMGRWSTALAPLFLDFASIGAGGPVLDIGCGTGNLLGVLRSRFPAAHLVGIDPSAALLARALQRDDLSEVELIAGDAERLPFADGSFAACLSLLVLQEFHGQPQPLKEMRRVTRPGGIVAACQWDFAQMPVIAALVEALATIGAGSRDQLAVTSRRHFNDEAELVAAWHDTGFSDISAARIRVTRRYRDFDELWLTLLAGSTPSTMVLATLPEPNREAVRRQLQARLDHAGPDGHLELVAAAIAVRGKA